MHVERGCASLCIHSDVGMRQWRMLFLCVVNKKNWCAVNVVVGLARCAGVVSLNVTFNVVLTAFTVEGVL